MKVIDILNKIANGGAIPYRIKYNENVYYYDLNLEWYIREDLKNELFIDRHHLRDNIEIIEDPQEHKIPEKLSEYADVSGDLACGWSFGEKKLKDKINEIIDYLEENNADRYN